MSADVGNREGMIRDKAIADLDTTHSLVDGPDLLGVQPTGDVHHADSATNELQHRLSLKEGGCSDVSVESQS